MEALTQAQHKAAASLYQQSAPGAGTTPGGDGAAGQASSAGGATSGGGAAAGDVIDAEVVDDK
jgi:hypothetical protein